MAFPTVVDWVASVSTATAVTTFKPTIPSGTVAGKMLLAFVTVDQAPSFIQPDKGWQLVWTDANATSVKQAIFQKVFAEGAGLDDFTVTINAARQWSAIVYCIDAGNYPGYMFASTNGSGTNTNPPAATNNLGLYDTLCLASRGGDSTVVPSVAPSGYSNMHNRAGFDTNGASTTVAERTANVSSENPGTFTVASEQWVSYTVMIWRDTTTRFSQWDKGTNCSLFDANLYPEINSGFFEQGLRGTLPRKDGKWGFKATIGHVDYTAIGVEMYTAQLSATSSGPPYPTTAVFLNDDDDSVSRIGMGDAAGGFSLDGPYTQMAVDDEIVCLVDATVTPNQFYVAVNGVWLNSANPDAGTGGIPFLSGTSDMWMWPFLKGDSEAGALFDFDATAFTGLSNCTSFKYWNFVASGTIYNESVSESVTAADLIAAACVFPRTVTEAATATDTPAATGVFPRTVTEAATAVDTVSAGNIINDSVSESAAANDNVSAAAVFPRTVTEAAIALDTISSQATQNVTMSEVASASDAYAAAAIFLRTIAESGNATDLVSAAMVRLGVIAEAATATDTVSAVGVFPRTVTEAANAQDQEDSSVPGDTAIAESAPITDQYSATVIRSVSVSELASASDAYSAVGIWPLVVAETAAITDAYTSSIVFGTSIFEAGNAQDTTNCVGSFAALIIEAADAQDAYESSRRLPRANPYNILMGPERIRSLFGPDRVRRLGGL